MRIVISEDVRDLGIVIKVVGLRSSRINDVQLFCISLLTDRAFSPFGSG